MQSLTSKEKSQALNLALDIINKSSSGIVTADELTFSKENTISTGISALDIATGTGGLLKGHIFEIFGDHMTGKTSLALQIASQVMKDGGYVLYIDADNGLSEYMINKSGVNKDGFCLAYPETIEEAFEMCRAAAENFDLIIIDTLTALPPRLDVTLKTSECVGDASGKLLQQGLNMVMKPLRKNNCTLLLLNQTRERTGICYGERMKPTGCKALKYYKALSLETRKFEFLKKDDEIYGFVVKVKIEKNKYGPPGRTAFFQNRF